ncbi:MAG TPA: hypothetical protein VGJ28_07510 [Micromonosporaceae bacterium]
MPNASHLQMIQTTIARAAAQAGSVKGWCVTVTAALLGFGATSNRPFVALVALYVVIAFATLDCYYLSIERHFRLLYDQAMADAVPEWSMAIARPAPADLVRALRSPSVFILYGSSMLAVGIVAIVTAVH